MFFKLNVFLAILVMWSIHCWIDCGSMDCGGGGGGGDWGGVSRRHCTFCVFW